MNHKFRREFKFIIKAVYTALIHNFVLLSAKPTAVGRFEPSNYSTKLRM